MLRFFRGLRSDAVAYGRIMRYLLYAIGEIALVVIGILIALYINDRRDFRTDRKQEVTYLREFYKDLEGNLEELDRVIEKSGLATRACDSIIAFSRRAPEDISNEQLMDFQVEVMGYTKHMTLEGTLEDLQGSGKLAVIRNDSIRRAMATWEADMRLLRELEVDGKRSFENYLDFLDEHFPFYERHPDMEYFKKVLLNQMRYLNRVSERAITTDYLHETYLGVKPRWEMLRQRVGREIKRLEKDGF
ncbi:DUF6090 family protein [Robiginitalea sp.]|uniref:DUF6090 family protein n=1 Tax=Robiginitalea sp. TaxID=1902411 RepID=UPI003C4DEDBF